LQYYNSGMTKYPDIVFEEMSLVILFVLAFVRKGDYL